MIFFYRTQGVHLRISLHQNQTQKKMKTTAMKTVDVNKPGVTGWLCLFGMILLKKWMWVLGILVLICLIPLFQWVFFDKKEDPKMAASLSEVGTVPAPPQAETPVVQQDPPAPPQAERSSAVSLSVVETTRQDVSPSRFQPKDEYRRVEPMTYDQQPSPPKVVRWKLVEGYLVPLRKMSDGVAGYGETYSSPPRSGELPQQSWAKSIAKDPENPRWTRNERGDWAIKAP